MPSIVKYIFYLILGEKKHQSYMYTFILYFTDV